MCWRGLARLSLRVGGKPYARSELILDRSLGSPRGSILPTSLRERNQALEDLLRHHEGIERDHALACRIGDDRIEVDLADRRLVAEQLTYAHDQVGEGIEIECRGAQVAAQQGAAFEPM